jgi:hypothetical protein
MLIDGHRELGRLTGLRRYRSEEDLPWHARALAHESNRLMRVDMPEYRITGLHDQGGLITLFKGFCPNPISTRSNQSIRQALSNFQ